MSLYVSYERALHLALRAKLSDNCGIGIGSFCSDYVNISIKQV